MATRADLENSLKKIGWFIDEETMEITNDWGNGTHFFLSQDENTIEARENATVSPIGCKLKFTLDEIVIDVNEDEDQVYFSLTIDERMYPFLTLNQLSKE